MHTMDNAEANVLYISTSYNKGISATTTVQCAATCKWLQPGSGQVDAFLTGLVDACARRKTCVRLRRQPRTKQINLAKSEAVQ